MIATVIAVAVAIAEVLAAMLSLPQYAGDRITDPPEARARLYAPVAEAISAVARNRTEAAALIAVGYSETAFARYVLDGHCEQGPAGARCDGGKARGPWQVWSWCRAAWEARDGSPEEKLGGARCAIGRLRDGRTACPGYAGMMSHYGRGHCSWKPAIGRAKLMATIEGRLQPRRAPKPPRPARSEPAPLPEADRLRRSAYVAAYRLGW